MGCAHKENQDGFTLVEISIVMIIIGLLIGGTFGGMKLIENMQVNRTVQDLKAIESAALTFKDTYGRLPGDMANTAARLPNCTVAPCATGGNGNRRIDWTTWNEALTAGMEKFTFWSHLQAADLLSLGTKNVTDLNFGEGQPEAAIPAGMRLVAFDGEFTVAGTQREEGAAIFMGSEPSAAISSVDWVVPCALLGSVDRKIDDGIIHGGFMTGWNCQAAAPNATEQYGAPFSGGGYYNLRSF
jgi:prepilin-type N-terminal cleavage/methylation domain-containing protein